MKMLDKSLNIQNLSSNVLKVSSKRLHFRLKITVNEIIVNTWDITKNCQQTYENAWQIIGYSELVIKCAEGVFQEITFPTQDDSEWH